MSGQGLDKATARPENGVRASFDMSVGQSQVMFLSHYSWVVTASPAPSLGLANRWANPNLTTLPGSLHEELNFSIERYHFSDGTFETVLCCQSATNEQGLSTRVYSLSRYARSRFAFVVLQV